MTTVDENGLGVIIIDSSELENLRSNVIKSQITAYRLLARSLPVSDSLLNLCSYKSQLATLIQNNFRQEQSTPTGIILKNSSETNDQNNSSTSVKFSLATDMYQWLVGLNRTDEEKLPNQIQKRPINLNPLYLIRQRDKR